LTVRMLNTSRSVVNATLNMSAGLQQNKSYISNPPKNLTWEGYLYIKLILLPDLLLFALSIPG
jgi:hypothetical protein